MKKLCLVLSVVMVALLFCQFAVAEAPDASGDPAVTLVYAEVNPLDTTVVGQVAMHFAERVHELTGGTVTIKPLKIEVLKADRKTAEVGDTVTWTVQASGGGAVQYCFYVFRDGKIVNSGGRVLVVSAEGATVSEAVEKAYAGVRKIHWEGVQYRTDIAWRAINRLK